MSGFAQRQQNSEIGVRRHEDTLFGRCSRQNHLIRSGLEPVVADMNCVMPRGAKRFGYLRREHIINEKLHSPEAKGNSRSRTAAAA